MQKYNKKTHTHTAHSAQRNVFQRRRDRKHYNQQPTYQCNRMYSSMQDNAQMTINLKLRKSSYNTQRQKHQQTEKRLHLLLHICNVICFSCLQWFAMPLMYGLMDRNMYNVYGVSLYGINSFFFYSVSTNKWNESQKTSTRKRKIKIEWNRSDIVQM